MSLNSCSSGGSGSGGNASGSGCGGGGSSSSPCGACKFLRRKCVAGCIFAPYFDSEQGSAHFAAVHRIFGASNVSKLLLNIPPNRRLDAVITICFEAQARLRDPVYGCVGHIFALQQQVMALQAEITFLQAHIPTTELQMPPPPPPPQAAVAPPAFSISDLPSTTTVAMPAANYDLSALFDPLPSWAVQQRAMDPRQYLATGPSPTTSGAFHAVAREYAHRHGPAAPGPYGPHGPSSNASSSLSKFSK